MTYYVEINYKKGPSFSVSKVVASDKEDAKTKVIAYGKNSGFNYPVKKVIVKEEI